MESGVIQDLEEARAKGGYREATLAALVERMKWAEKGALRGAFRGRNEPASVQGEGRGSTFAMQMARHSTSARDARSLRRGPATMGHAAAGMRLGIPALRGSRG